MGNEHTLEITLYSVHFTRTFTCFIRVNICIIFMQTCVCVQCKLPTAAITTTENDDHTPSRASYICSRGRWVWRESKDFCCCHNDNTKTKKQETRMMKIFGRFHLNNISCSPFDDDCTSVQYEYDCRPATTTFRARTHTLSRGVLRAYVIKTESRACVRASEVYKHANEIRLVFFPPFSFFLVLFVCTIYYAARLSSCL